MGNNCCCDRIKVDKKRSDVDSDFDSMEEEDED